MTLSMIPLLIAAASLSAVTAPALIPEASDPVPSLHVSFEQALKAALADNSGLKSLDHQVRAADRQARAAERARWGRVDAFLSYSRFNDDWLVRPMSEQLFEEAGSFAGLPWDDNQTQWGANFEIPLYLGGSLTAAIQVARLQADHATALAQGTRWQVRFNATALYSAAQALDQVILAQNNLLKALERTREVLDLMVQVGKRSELERLKVVAALEEASAAKAAMLAERHRVGSLLRALMNQDPAMKIEVDTLVHRRHRLAADSASLRTDLDSSSTVRRALFVAEQAARLVQVERSAFLPKIMASGNYSWHDAPSVNGSLNTWGLSVGVSIPVFAGGSRTLRLGAARENEAASQENLNRIRLDSAAQLEQALAAYKAAGHQVTATRARVAAATEAARIEQIRYDTGVGAVEDLLLACATEQQARASMAQALASSITGDGLFSTRGLRGRSQHTACRLRSRCNGGGRSRVGRGGRTGASRQRAARRRNRHMGLSRRQ